MSNAATNPGESAETAISRLRHWGAAFYLRRTSIAWSVAAAVTGLSAAACTTIRVRDSFLDVDQLRLLVGCIMCVAVTCILLAVKVRSERTHVLSWLCVAVALVCCIVLT